MKTKKKDDGLGAHLVDTRRPSWETAKSVSGLKYGGEGPEK